MGLIVAAIATGFIDAIPVEVTIGLCALGVVAGLVGVPLYVAHLLAGWRSSGPSPTVAPARDEVEPADARAADSTEATVAPPVAVEPELEPEPEPESEPEPELGDDEDGSTPAVSMESAGAADAPPERCSCHGLPVRN
ncbi:hypothetical protein ACXYTP_02960 [Tsukamurella ocularis]|uniref:hypothetical protein n=1 Tax=Tsukamurella ocularis TaxID=1970234 RepID=UPI0039EF3C7F